jgi:hypothetical protein
MNENVVVVCELCGEAIHRVHVSGTGDRWVNDADSAICPSGRRYIFHVPGSLERQ